MAGCWWLVVAMLVASVFSDPQTTQLGNLGCSDYTLADPSHYIKARSASFADLRNQLSQNNKRFATAQYNPIYAMVQCRNYLSTADCVACFDAAVKAAGNCSFAIFDGCFIRNQDSYFYDQTTDPIRAGFPVCGTRSANKQDIFNTSVQQLLSELVTATPRITGFYAAAKQGESGGDGSTIYGVAQCTETVSQSGCQDCLATAYRNIQGCLPQFAYGRGVDAGCFLRYSDTPFFADNQTTNIAPFLGKGGGGSSGKKKSKGILAGIVSSVGIVLVLGVLFLLYRQSRRTEAWRRGNIFGASQLKGSEKYKYKDLKDATTNFSQENEIGKGGFGEVYKGTLQSGGVVAVKKLATISNRVKTDFLSEVSLITNVHHPNLIRLLGYSGNGRVLLLVYEYMANASLDRYIYGEKRGMLNWKQRVDVIFGTAKGLAYLHEVSIIHRDIKSSNILLDDDFHPKIADFGLAKLKPVDKSHLTTKFAGTLGYTAPEYAIHGHLSERVDVYSFGIVVLEIISGRKSCEIRVEPVTEFLLEQAWKLYENDEHLELVDNSLDPNEYTAEEMKRMFEIALVCTQSPANLRPTMSQVINMLSNTDGSIIPKPKNRPTTINYLDKRVPLDTTTYTNAAISLSHFSGR